MTHTERTRLLAEHGVRPIFVTTVEGTMIAVTKTAQGYQARIIGKGGTILATGCQSEEAAVLAAAVA